MIQAIALGIIQGLTEWLPISSTAHLRIVPALVGWPDPGAAFTAAIQLGTLVAVLVYFWKDLVTILLGWIGGLMRSAERSTSEYRLGWGIFLGTVPIIVCGVLLKNTIENQARSLWIVATALIAMGLVLAVAEQVGKRTRAMNEASVKDGIWVGIWQAIALIPGASRSGSTLAGALFAGFDRETSARYAFVLSVPSVLGAGVYSLSSHRNELIGSNLMPILVANLFSFVVGYATIAYFMKFLKSHSTLVFVGYRITLGLALFGLILTGKLSPEAGMPASPLVETTRR
jgi:undecaprenyl-diphosphatase